MDRRRALNRGFTLLEIMIVLVIGALLFAAAAPRTSDRDQCGASARSVVSDGARARSYAARIWEPVTLDVDVANGAWRVTRQNGSWLELPGVNQNGWRTLDPGLSFEVVEGYATDTVFLPNGRISAEARVRLRSGNDTWLLKVETMTGRITADPES